MKTVIWKRQGIILALIFAAYTAIAVVALWNLAANFDRAVPNASDSDFYQFHWNYWWMRFAVQNGQSPLWTNYVLYPHSSNLVLHTLAPIWLPLYMVAEPLVGRVAAVNLMALLSFPLTGFATFLWLRRHLNGSESRAAVGIAAFLGGLIFAFSPYMLYHAAKSHLNLTTLWWFPLTLLLWDEVAAPRRLHRVAAVILLGLSLWGALITDLQYALWLPFTLGPYALWTLLVARQDRGWIRLVGLGVLAVVVTLVLCLVYPIPALLQLDRNPLEFPPASLYTARAYSLLPGTLAGLEPPTDDRTLGRVLPWLALAGIGLLVLRSVGATRRSPLRHKSKDDRPSPWFWLLIALPSLILTLGPDVALGGTVIPLPYRLLHDALGGQYRNPVRFAAPAAACLITFAALSWRPILERIFNRQDATATQRRIGVLALTGVVIGFLILFDAGVFAPFPVRIMPDYSLYHQIAVEGGDFVILDVPVGTHSGWTGMGTGHIAMFYGPDHQHRMVDGTFSRVPYSTLAFYMDSPLFSWLADASDLDAPDLEAAAGELQTYLREWPLGYVIIHRDWSPPARQSEWIGWLNMQPGFCPPEMTPDALLLWWRNQTLGCADSTPTERIDLGASADWLRIGAGWYDPEIIGGPDARWSGQEAALRVRLEPGQRYELTFSALAFGEGRTVTFGGPEVFGEPISLAADGWYDYTVVIPADALAGSILTLRHNGAESPALLGLSEDTRQLAAAYQWFDFRPMEEQ